MVRLERRYVDTRTGQLHVTLAEPSAAASQPPLVCFHMSPWSGVVFEPFLAEIGTDRLAIAIDTPGYGNSDPWPEPPLMTDYAAAVADAAQALRLDSFDVLGDRTGAKLAIAVAAALPDGVRRLILISPVIWGDAQRALRETYAPEPLSEDGTHASALWRLSVGLSMPDRSLDRLAEIFHVRLLHPDIAHLGRRAAAAYDAAAALDRVRQPVLVLDPGDDLAGVARDTRPYLHHPASRIEARPDWGYGFVDARPAELAEAARRFLDAPI